jgi:hypothetical protein
MMKFYAIVLAGLMSLIVALGLEASAASRELKAKQDIIKEDQIDTTSIFAIPLDDSEVEDQEELDYIQEREREFKKNQ